MPPEKPTSAEFQFVSWSAPEAAWKIEYPLEVMDEIRAFACNELSQLVHKGAEVGGVMYGSQRSGVIRVLTWRPIASEFAEGETLRLSHHDRMNLAVQLEVARGSPELKDLRPVGWFVSHPNGGVAMTSSDLKVYADFFPELSQVTLVLHPTEGGRTEAGFFMRAADGSVRSEASYQDFILMPLERAAADHARPAAASDVEPASPIPAPESAAPPPVVPLPSAPLPSAPALSTPAPSTPAPSTPAPSTPAPSTPAPSLAIPNIIPPALPVPNFEIHEPLPLRERWLWAIPIALALGLAGWLLYQRQKPAENPSLAFRVTSSAAGTAQLEWNANSRAVRDSDHGEIDITDNGKSAQVLLSSDQLHSGKLAYLPRSSDVAFQLTIYPSSGAPLHEATRLTAPAISTQPPQLLAPAPKSAPAPSAPAPKSVESGESDALQKQIRQLSEDLRKEHARNVELQNLNRILENRLSIQPDKTGQQ